MPHRLLLIGPGGAGKSTLARELAARLNLPLIHLDSCYWQPGWVEPAKADWADRVDALIAGERWVMDGNYGGTLERRFARADTVIWLDLPPLVCAARVLRRWWRYRGRPRPELPDGCPEKLSLEFFQWIWTYGRTRRPKIRQLLAAQPHLTVIHLRTRRAVKRFRAALPAAG